MGEGNIVSYYYVDVLYAVEVLHVDELLAPVISLVKETRNRDGRSQYQSVSLHNVSSATLLKWGGILLDSFRSEPNPKDGAEVILDRLLACEFLYGELNRRARLAS